MSRDDYDEEDDRPRRRRRRDEEDYDDVSRPRRGGRSGSVTGVGIISIILGSLTLLCGLCTGIGSLYFSAAAGGPGMRQRNPFPFQAAAGVAIVVAVVILILGVFYLVGGIGVLQRRTWGRIMTLVMAGFSGLLGVLCLIAIVALIAQPAPGEAKAIGILVYFVGVALYFTHCIMSFVVLLSSQNAMEFD